ncbi:hypothetical protein [Burkholderia sp. MSMB1078WGS]|uniref:hypothetical protein n=1 Tax=Burkholderia sp. MSMB1078WGS TaxID=1637900 RepID=UPI0012E33430|nr:hypothetical protein [Burkholderia sp. MSMB1078WGS]
MFDFPLRFPHPLACPCGCGRREAGGAGVMSNHACPTRRPVARGGPAFAAPGKNALPTGVCVRIVGGRFVHGSTRHAFRSAAEDVTPRVAFAVLAVKAITFFPSYPN